MKSIPPSLRERRREWVRSVNEGDIEAYAGILAEEAVWIPPNGEPIEGREAFKKWLTPFVANFNYRYEIDEERIQVSGNRAMERARFRSTLTPITGGEPQTHSGTFTVLWIRGADGTWYIERYIDDTQMQ